VAIVNLEMEQIGRDLTICSVCGSGNKNFAAGKNK